MSGRFLRLFHQQRLELYAAQRAVECIGQQTEVADERGRLSDRVVLREGDEPAVTHAEMLTDMKILDAVFESDRTGNAVSL